MIDSRKARKNKKKVFSVESRGALDAESAVFHAKSRRTEKSQKVKYSGFLARHAIDVAPQHDQQSLKNLAKSRENQRKAENRQKIDSPLFHNQQALFSDPPISVNERFLYADALWKAKALRYYASKKFNKIKYLEGQKAAQNFLDSVVDLAQKPTIFGVGLGAECDEIVKRSGEISAMAREFFGRAGTANFRFVDKKGVRNREGELVGHTTKQGVFVSLSDSSLDALVAEGERILEMFCVVSPLKCYKTRANTRAEKADLIRKLSLSSFWIRRMRAYLERAREQLYRKASIISSSSDVYISKASSKIISMRNSRNLKALKKRFIKSSSGDVVSLFDAYESSVSCPVNRFAELLARVKGVEEVQRRTESVSCVFITMTAPSRFHSMNKGRNGLGAFSNKRFDDSLTPADAMSYFNKCLSRIRANLIKQGIESACFKVVEPHHDGCPHVHLGVYVEDRDRKKLIKIYESEAVKEDFEEIKKDISPRFTAKKVSCSLSSYLFKYFLKNIETKSELQKSVIDYESRGNCCDSAVSVSNWCSLWGIKQFSFIGCGASVGVYRQLARFDGSAEKKARDGVSDKEFTSLSSRFSGLVKSCKSGYFDDYLSSAGDNWLSVARVEKRVNVSAGTPSLESFVGDVFKTVKVVVGLFCDAFLVLTKTKAWRKMSSAEMATHTAKLEGLELLRSCRERQALDVCGSSRFITNNRNFLDPPPLFCSKNLFLTSGDL